MDLFLWIYIGATLLCLLISWPVYANFRTVPEVPSGETLPEIRISVIIPARNEEKNLAVLLPTITGQSLPPHEIIVVDDNSTDCTSDIAEDNKATLVSGTPLPEGWMGKQWAISQGAKVATGDWLLFLDADTALENDAFEKLTLLSRSPDRVHSICPYHRIEKKYEELSAFFNVIMLLGTNAFSLKGEQGEGIGLFGQMLFVRKDHYEKVGGHESVRKLIPENFHLARHFREAGLTCCCYLGKGTATMRMFPEGYRQLVASWSKGFVSGADHTPPSAMFGISMWLSGIIMSAMGLLFVPVSSFVIAPVLIFQYLLSAITCLCLFKRVGNFAFTTALLYPFALLFYLKLFYQSKGRKEKGEKTQWKGRDVI